LKDKQDLGIETEANYGEDKTTLKQTLFHNSHMIYGVLDWTLEGLLKLLNSGDIKESEFKEFIPKLKNDVEQYSFYLEQSSYLGTNTMREATPTIQY